MKFQDYRLMKNKNILVPKLRFPEFINSEDWSVVKLNDAFTRITSKNKENNQNVLTISAQKGLVSQLEYFNKSIAAKDVSGYYLIKKGDFAYNKSYSQGYPMGAIKPLKYYDKGVVSTLYICFRINKKYNPSFFEQYFDAGILNCKLEKIAQEGARNHGLLNINVNDFFNLELIVPKTAEQQKIADLLTSVDELIAEQRKKIDALKDHKKGLMQQLFPAEGETVPKLRFSEFMDAGEWEEKTLEEVLISISNGISIEQGDKFVGYKVTRIETISDQRINIEKVGYIQTTQNISRYKLNVGDILFSNINSLSQIGKTALVDQDYNLYHGMNLLRLIIKKELNDSSFLFYLLNTEIIKKSFRNRANQAINQASINQYELGKTYIYIPDLKEQEKIADCLLSLDNLIEGQSNKLAALQMHKKRLMQQVFPTYE